MISYLEILKPVGSDIHRFKRIRGVVNDFNHIGILTDYEYSLSRSMFVINVCLVFPLYSTKLLITKEILISKFVVKIKTDQSFCRKMPAFRGKIRGDS